MSAESRLEVCCVLSSIKSRPEGHSTKLTTVTILGQGIVREEVVKDDMSLICNITFLLKKLKANVTKH